MTNRVLNKNIVSNNADDSVPESNFTRQQDALEASATDENRTRIATSGNAYPALPPNSPWSAPAPNFDPYTDRVDEPTSMVTGIDMTTLSGAPPPEVCPCPQATEGEIAPSAPAAVSPSSLKRRF
jgi:hypothetical protein